MAVHAGEVAYDEHGVTAAAVTFTFRLVDAAPVKSALTQSPGSLALVVSPWFFDEVVRHSKVVDPATFRPVEVAEKETTCRAWISLPDHPYPADPRHLADSGTDSSASSPDGAPPVQHQRRRPGFGPLPSHHPRHHNRRAPADPGIRRHPRRRGLLNTTWNGALYGTLQERGPVVLDARTGQDRESSPGNVPDLVNEYAAVQLIQESEKTWTVQILDITR